MSRRNLITIRPYRNLEQLPLLSSIHLDIATGYFASFTKWRRFSMVFAFPRTQHEYSQIKFNVPSLRECLRFSRYRIVSTNGQPGTLAGIIQSLVFRTRESFEERIGFLPNVNKRITTMLRSDANSGILRRPQALSGRRRFLDRSCKNGDLISTTSNRPYC